MRESLQPMDESKECPCTCGGTSAIEWVENGTDGINFGLGRLGGHRMICHKCNRWTVAEPEPPILIDTDSSHAERDESQEGRIICSLTKNAPCDHEWNNGGLNPEYCEKCGMSFTRYSFMECE